MTKQDAIRSMRREIGDLISTEKNEEIIRECFDLLLNSRYQGAISDAERDRLYKLNQEVMNAESD